MVLRPLTVMELQPLTSHQSTVAISWPTHACGGTLDLLMTDVPDLVRVAVVAAIGNSDHSSLPAVISMAQAVPNLCVIPETSSQLECSLWCNTGSAQA